MEGTPISIYVHVPFCEHRCAYCDFNTFAGSSELIPAFVEALKKEIYQISTYGIKITPKTLFFGGGTPSLLSPAQLEQIICQFSQVFDLSELEEISIEINPGTVKQGFFKDVHSLGFNRVSLGVQSSQPRFLKFLDRIHDFQDVINSLNLIRKANFTNINLDMIYSIPGQTLQDWESDLTAIINFDTSHLSLYSLGIETGTPLAKWYSKGLIEKQDDDLAADQYDLACDLLAKKGYSHYEISNWAVKGFECKHNLAYWRNDDYLGFGPGSHGHFQGLRYSNVLGIRSYIKAFTTSHPIKINRFPLTSAVHQIDELSSESSLQNALMVGLRLLQEGVNLEELKLKYGLDVREIYKKEIRNLHRDGLITLIGDRMILTDRAKFIGNKVFSVFINPKVSQSDYD